MSRTKYMVSAVVIAHNGEQYLENALNSVFAQTRPADEVIVVDDGSTDATASVAGRYPDVRYVYQSQAGPAAARNRGVKESTGDVIAFLDCDDVWMPDKTARQLAYLDDSDVGLVTGHARVIDEVRGEHRLDLGASSLKKSGWRHRLILKNSVGNPSRVLMRRQLFEQAGGFDADLLYAEDWDLWLRSACLTSFKTVDSAVVDYRWHQDNLSHRTFHLQAAINRRVASHSIGLVEGRLRRAWYRLQILARFHLETSETNHKRSQRLAAATRASIAFTLDPFHEVRRKGAIIWRSLRPRREVEVSGVRNQKGTQSVPLGLTVSAIVLVYNGERYVREAIESVLAQTRVPDEIVVLDNGSTDRTAEIATSFPEVCCVSLPENVGAAGGYNRGAAEATGDLIAFLDYDDAWLPNKTEWQVAMFEDHPDTAVVSGLVVWVDEVTGKTFLSDSTGPTGEPFPRSLVYKNHVGNMSVAMIRRQAFFDNGGMDPRHPWGDDWHLWLQIVADQEIRFVDAPLLRYRWHASNLSHDRMRQSVIANEQVAVGGMRRLLPRRSWPIARARIRSWHELQLSHVAAEEGRRRESGRRALVALMVFPFADIKAKVGNVYRAVTRRRSLRE